MGAENNESYYYYYDENTTCPDGYERFHRELTHPKWTHHLNAGLAYVILAFNILVFYMFKKDARPTSATMLFMCLAVSDSIAAFAHSFPWHLGTLFDYIQDDGDVVRLRASFCAVFVILEGPFYYAMNDTSILITTLLGIMKVLAVQFPIWFKINAKCKIALGITLVMFLACIGLEMYPVFSFSFQADDGGMCCTSNAYFDYVYDYSAVGTWVIPLLFLLSFISMIFTTSFVIAKLFCCRENKKMIKVSEATRQKNLQLARMLIIVTVVFIVCEILDFIAVISMLTTSVLGLPDPFEMDWFNATIKYQKIIQMLGYASNFVIYLMTSKDTRSNFFQLYSCAFCRHQTNVSSSSDELNMFSSKFAAIYSRKLSPPDSSGTTKDTTHDRY